MFTYPVGLLSPRGVPVPTDAIHEWLFSNNVLDTGSSPNNLTINGGVIGDIMTSDRNSNANSAFESSNASIYLSCTAITVSKGMSLNWWQNVPSGNSFNITYRAAVARFIVFVGSSFDELRTRSNNGSNVTYAVLTGYDDGLWHNFHLNFNNTSYLYVDGGSWDSQDCSAQDIFLFDRVFSAPTATILNSKGDDFRIFNRELTLGEIQAIAAS